MTSDTIAAAANYTADRDGSFSSDCDAGNGAFGSGACGNELDAIMLGLGAAARGTGLGAWFFLK